MNTRPSLCAYYWRDDRLIGNMGDALVPILLRGLGYDCVTRAEATATVVNAGRCLITIGSLLTPEDLSRLEVPLDVWGCGWKGLPLPPSMLARLDVHAVRGPNTVDGLGFAPDTPIGDPALLLPRLAPRSIREHGRTVVVPHSMRVRQMSARARRHRTGCDDVVSVHVVQAHRFGCTGWPRQMVSLCKAWLHLGLRPRTPWEAIERVVGAGFVLTGSLHGAILAQAYGMPWAAYDDGYIDAPAKWQDWAAYLGIQIEFVATLKDGQRWWQREGQRGTLRDLDPLLNAFPYPQTKMVRAK